MTWTTTDIAQLLADPDGFWQSYCSNDAGSVIGTRSHIIDGFGLTQAQHAYPVGHVGVDNLRCVLRRLADLFPSLDHRTTGAQYGQGKLWEPAMPSGWLPRNFTFATVAFGQFAGTYLEKPGARNRSTLPRLFVFLRDGNVHLALDCLDSVHAAWRAGPFDLWVRRYRDGEAGLLITRAPVCCTDLDHGRGLSSFLMMIYETLPARSDVDAIYPGRGARAGVAEKTHEDDIAGGEDDEDIEADSDNKDGDVATSAGPLTFRIHSTPYQLQPGIQPTVFETLYDLAIDIRVQPNYACLTAHGGAIPHIAEVQLQTDLMQLTMPGYTAVTSWDVAQIFILNYINGGRWNPGGIQSIQQWFAGAGVFPNTYSKINHLVVSAPHFAIHPNIVATAISLNAPPPAAIGYHTWIDWIVARKLHWQNIPCAAIATAQLLNDINTVAPHFHGLGLALAANFFADIGLPAFAKPDLHVNSIIGLLGLLTRVSDDKILSAIVRLAQSEAPTISNNRRFNFLVHPAGHVAGGLYPRHIDRLIYLIGSDNHGLTGTRRRNQSPARHQLMVERLVQAGFLGATYWRRI